MDIKRVIGPLIAAVVAAVALAGAAQAIPEQGTPEFDIFLQALLPNRLSVDASSGSSGDHGVNVHGREL
jgi:hypothetical protein